MKSNIEDKLTGLIAPMDFIKVLTTLYHKACTLCLKVCTLCHKMCTLCHKVCTFCRKAHGTFNNIGAFVGWRVGRRSNIKAIDNNSIWEQGY